jgi:hypothetical protein
VLNHIQYPISNIQYPQSNKVVKRVPEYSGAKWKGGDDSGPSLWLRSIKTVIQAFQHAKKGEMG